MWDRAMRLVGDETFIIITFPINWLSTYLAEYLPVGRIFIYLKFWQSNDVLRRD